MIVLQAIAALQMAPDDPMEAAKQLQNLEKMLLESDPKSQERKEVTEIIAAMKLLKKRRGVSRTILSLPKRTGGYPSCLGGRAY